MVRVSHGIPKARITEVGSYFIINDEWGKKKRPKYELSAVRKKKVAHEAQPSVSLMFLPHFDVLCDLLLNRRTATWNLFVLYNKELKKVSMMTSSIVCPPIDHK